MARLFRDAHGIPHVRGADVLDVARGQGRACALDRPWSLEWLRRRATGTTAGLVGEAGEPWDRFAAGVRVADTAQRAFAALDAETRAFVEAYVEGVGQGLAEREPVGELAALGARAEPWPAWMPLGAFHAQQVLFAGFGVRLWQARVREVLGEDAVLLERERADPTGATGAGSNAWVVGGALTASGRPLVGGDPHRTLESPGVYHQVRLACDDPADPFDVVGFSFAGVPGVQHFAHAVAPGDGSAPGRTHGVAWAITNAMADYQDVVAATDGTPTAMPGIGFRGASTELGDLGFAALLPLLRARTVADVDRALDHWVEPVNNVVVADTAGTVRYRLAGRVPVRDDAGEWTGWLGDVHRVDAGDDGLLVTANDRRGPESAAVGRDFAPPFRAERIRALLAERTGLTTSDFAAVHADALLADVDAYRPFLPAPLRDFDGVMTADSTLAGGFAAWRGALVRRVAAAPALAPLHAPPPDPVFAPWFDVTVSVGLALPGLLRHGRPFGLDVAALAEQAAADVADVLADPPPWGATHVFAPLHPLTATGAAPALPRPGLDGDQDCVRCVGSLPGLSDDAYRGSVARYVWDLADREAGGWVVPMGASGVPGDPHHLDQLPAWSDARLLPIVTDWARLTEEAPTGGFEAPR